MRVTIMLDWGINDEDDSYEPAGVWAVGDGGELGLAYLDDDSDAAARAQEVQNRLVEIGARELPPDFLQYHQGTLPPYLGQRGPIYQVDDYVGTVDQAAEWFLDQVKASWDSGARVWDQPLPGWEIFK